MQLVDKIIIDTKDYPELAEFFSRREVGDICKGNWEASVDENNEGVVTLSIKDIGVANKDYGDEETKGSDTGDEAPASAAEKLMAQKNEEDSAQEPDESKT